MQVPPPFKFSGESCCGGSLFVTVFIVNAMGCSSASLSFYSGLVVRGAHVCCSVDSGIGGAWSNNIVRGVTITVLVVGKLSTLI